MYILYTRLTTTINEEPVGSVDYCIAGSMLEKIMQLSEFSITDMANLCNVSKSTISKFIRKLGFDDYSDFRLEAIRQKQKEVYFSDGRTINITDYVLSTGIDSYLDILQKDIRSLVWQVDYEKINQLVTDIHDYKNVAAFGEIYSQTVALNLQYTMSLYRKFIYTVINDIKQESYIEHADENTLIIIFSNSGRYVNLHPTKDGMPERECFKKTKGKVVVITSNDAMEKDPKVAMAICYKHSSRVQNHPFLLQFIVELIAIRYQKIYGLP